jgi:hypothetical protein
MNAERLHNVLYELNEETSRNNVPALLKNFQNTFNQSITQPNPQTSAAFIELRDALWTILKGNRSNFLPPSSARIVTAIGGEQYYGNGLVTALQGIIDDNAATPGQAVSAIQEHIMKADELYASVKTAHESLEKLNVTCDFTEKDEYEVGILLPPELFDNNIDDLATELHLLNRHIKVFGELAGADTSNPTIRSISNGSLELFLNALPDVAKCIAEAIEYIVIMYLSILQIRKYRKELKEEKVPDDALKPLADHEKQRVTEELNRIAEELFKKYGKKSANRNQELKGLLFKALSYLAKRIDQGADFEVSPPSDFEDLAEDASEEQKKQAKAQHEAAQLLLSTGQSVKRLPGRKQEVLSLPEPRTTKEDKDKP